MKAKPVYLIFMIVLFFSCYSCKQQDKQVSNPPDQTLSGKWVRMGQMGAISFNFREDGMVEGDFGNDQVIDVISKYEISDDTIKFIDEEGQMCEGYGLYRVFLTDQYVSFDLIDDECGGRISTTMGFWTRPEFNDFIQTIDEEIAKSPAPELYLTRARIYLATGMTQEAKADFDTYLLTDTLDARVYLNRAGTRFPNDLEGVVMDCTKALSLDPGDKNAYFLRGLARYELGEHEQACEDFSQAIALGFSILRIAEQERCREYWD